MEGRALYGHAKVYGACGQTVGEVAFLVLNSGKRSGPEIKKKNFGHLCTDATLRESVR
jgi:hypothetical protein